MVSGNGNGKHNGNGAGPSMQSMRRIKEAAQMRVEGATWEVIAVRYSYANAKCAKNFLQGRYQDLWRSEYEIARATLLDGVEAEALLTQRDLLRATDDRIRQSAAHSLLAHCAKLRMKDGPDINVNIDNRTESPVELLRREFAECETAATHRS